MGARRLHQQVKQMSYEYFNNVIKQKDQIAITHSMSKVELVPSHCGM
uniref:Uncharacterized protein n=1 Tax=Anguilla anguilla TaxID=7936 RepID=A0A0E9QB13_ANGAN